MHLTFSRFLEPHLIHTMSSAGPSAQGEAASCGSFLPPSLPPSSDSRAPSLLVSTQLVEVLQTESPHQGCGPEIPGHSQAHVPHTAASIRSLPADPLSGHASCLLSLSSESAPVCVPPDTETWSMHQTPGMLVRGHGDGWGVSPPLGVGTAP